MTVTERTAILRDLIPLLFVEDIHRSVAFYRDTLGFELAETLEAGGNLYGIG